MEGQPKMPCEILISGILELGDERWNCWLVRFGRQLKTEDVFAHAPSTDVMERVHALELSLFREQYKELIEAEWYPMVGLCRAGDSPVFLTATDEKPLAASGRPDWRADCTFLFIAESAVQTAA